MAEKYGRNKRWVQRQLENVNVSEQRTEPGDVTIVMDTTYFRRTFGVMVWRCPHRRKNLLWRFVPYETVEGYIRGIDELEERGWNVKAIVCDGRRGLFQAFPIPVQMCHFHQAQIVTRYVTRKPKLQASTDLQALMRLLPHTDEASFTYWLEQWYVQWRDFIMEKTVDADTKKWHYTHKRLRSAFNSVRRNLPFLFAFERYPDRKIPNTTNSLDGTFTHIKDKVRLHRGLKLHRKQKLISELLKDD